MWPVIPSTSPFGRGLSRTCIWLPGNGSGPLCKPHHSNTRCASGVWSTKSATSGAWLFPGVPLYGIHSGDEHVQTALAPERFAAGLLSSFAIVAAVVAAIGLYGIVAFSVARRRREIGIRMAIGATQGTIVRGILGAAPSSPWTGVGLVFGAVGACVTMRLIASQVKGVSPYDPVTIAAVALLLCAASAVAALIPALRAARVDPLKSLRSE